MDGYNAQGGFVLGVCKMAFAIMVIMMVSCRSWRMGIKLLKCLFIQITCIKSTLFSGP